jgi:hypothetical protein
MIQNFYKKGANELRATTSAGVFFQAAFCLKKGHKF